MMYFAMFTYIRQSPEFVFAVQATCGDVLRSVHVMFYDVFCDVRIVYT